MKDNFLFQIEEVDDKNNCSYFKGSNVINLCVLESVTTHLNNIAGLSNGR